MTASTQQVQEVLPNTPMTISEYDPISNPYYYVPFRCSAAPHVGAMSKDDE